MNFQVIGTDGVLIGTYNETRAKSFARAYRGSTIVETPVTAPDSETRLLSTSEHLDMVLENGTYDAIGFYREGETFSSTYRLENYGRENILDMMMICRLHGLKYSFFNLSDR